MRMRIKYARKLSFVHMWQLYVGYNYCGHITDTVLCEPLYDQSWAAN